MPTLIEQRVELKIAQKIAEEIGCRPQQVTATVALLGSPPYSLGPDDARESGAGREAARIRDAVGGSLAKIFASGKRDIETESRLRVLEKIVKMLSTTPFGAAL